MKPRVAGAREKATKKKYGVEKKIMKLKLSESVTNERVRAPYHLTFCNQKSFKIVLKKKKERTTKAASTTTTNAHTTNKWAVDMAID